MAFLIEILEDLRRIVEEVEILITGSREGVQIILIVTEIDINTNDEIQEVIETVATADLIAKIVMSEAITKILIIAESWIGTDGEMEAREIGMSLKAVEGLVNHYVSLVLNSLAVQPSMATDTTFQDQNQLLKAYL